MKVSVIIPTYNSSRYICESVRSVLEQTVRDLEVIVIDDGSTDSTQEAVAAMNDSRLRVMKTDNQGIGAARAEGLKYAQGEFIAFNNADDIWRPRILERALAIMGSEPAVGAIFTDFIRFSDRGVFPQTQFAFFPELKRVPSVPTKDGHGRRVLGDAFVHFIGFSQFPAWVQTMLFRANVVRDIEFPRERLVTADMHYTFRVFQKTSVAYIEEPLVEVRRHDANATKDLDLLERDVHTTLCQLEEEVDHSIRRAALRRRIGRSWITLGDLFLQRRNRWDAIAAYKSALGYPFARVKALQRLGTFPIRAAVNELAA